MIGRDREVEIKREKKRDSMGKMGKMRKWSPGDKNLNKKRSSPKRLMFHVEDAKRKLSAS